MNIVFFGSSHFAVASLKALKNSGHKVSCVVTQPDKKQGRGLSIGATAIKELAREFNLKIFQPENINIPEAIKPLKGLNPDLFVVIAYGQILSSGIFNIPKIFSLNVHASLLPKYRGAAPINWAIIKGEKIAGITVIKMTKEMDAGPIIQQKETEISNLDTSITLEDKLSGLATQLLLSTLLSIEDNNYNLIPQDENEVSFAPKLKKEDGRIDWNKAACDIYNLIRGCISWPGAFTNYKGKLLKIYKARVSSQVSKFASSNPGEILEATKEGIVVATGKDNLIIEELQIEGKRRMRAEEFIAGHKVCIGEIFNKK
ncbi:MAG: methionyl-tRNA formyltransferase [Candidatus Omnitrophota bacterium]|nr:methionyl-tRNA formyltransferase [Candidatus Omnitrophota bacterium]